ncbi:MAG: imidazole glycerol phosphate synthase subunit HisH [Candidatus Omnitrophica bacterium]|nr:imidazole glycerol phosphate synthase subunit HisH [Candidatus Omnitrophota bacterium]
MIAIIDYKMGNVRSVAKALESLGAKVELTASKTKLAKARALVLPGVGAFAAGMKNLRKLNLIPEIKKAIAQNKPFLGICLGQQLLFSQSYEHGKHKGLDIIPGEVVMFKPGLKIPHMGWNTITQEARRKTQDTSGLLKGVPDGSYFYFVHSYYVKPVSKKWIIATTEYGQKFSSIVGQGNTFGIQFHPEKSSDIGLRILKNFCEIAGELE